MNFKYNFWQTKFTKQLLSLLGLFILTASSLWAQPGGGIEMADKLREDGKIWVVVGVIVLIFIGIITYLIRLDRKISRLEKQVRKE